MASSALCFPLHAFGAQKDIQAFAAIVSENADECTYNSSVLFLSVMQVS